MGGGLGVKCPANSGVRSTSLAGGLTEGRAQQLAERPIERKERIRESLMGRRHFQELSRRQCSPCKSRLQNCTFEMIFEINANPHGRMTRPLGGQLHATLALQLIVDIVTECFPVSVFPS